MLSIKAYNIHIIVLSYGSPDNIVSCNRWYFVIWKQKSLSHTATAKVRTEKILALIREINNFGETFKVSRIMDVPVVPKVHWASPLESAIPASRSRVCTRFQAWGLFPEHCYRSAARGRGVVSSRHHGSLRFIRHSIEACAERSTSRETNSRPKRPLITDRVWNYCLWLYNSGKVNKFFVHRNMLCTCLPWYDLI